MLLKAKVIVALSIIAALLIFNVLWTRSNSLRADRKRENIQLVKGLHRELQLENLTSTKSGFGSSDDFFMNMKNYSLSQMPVRKRTLGQIHQATQYPLLYGAMAPEVFCPEKVRLGTIGDGGKWVCNPWKVPNDSVLFSLGLNNLITFEMDWQKLLSNRSRLYGFDSEGQSEKSKKEYASIRGIDKVALISQATDESQGQFTINDLAKQANISQIEILKIDIEGAEKTCLIPFLEEFQVCQIYLEAHGGAHEHLKVLQQVAHLDYRLFSYEINGYDMAACEYSFIHESCVDFYGAKRVANFLDFTA